MMYNNRAGIVKGARLGDVTASFMPSLAPAVRGTKSLRTTFNGAIHG